MQRGNTICRSPLKLLLTLNIKKSRELACRRELISILQSSGRPYRYRGISLFPILLCSLLKTLILCNICNNKAARNGVTEADEPIEASCLPSHICQNLLRNIFQIKNSCHNQSIYLSQRELSPLNPYSIVPLAFTPLIS